MCSKLELTDHVQLRMRQRGITLEYIREAFRIAKMREPGSEKGTYRIAAHLKDKTLCVIFRPLENFEQCLIITAFWPEEVN